MLPVSKLVVLFMFSLILVEQGPGIQDGDGLNRNIGKGSEMSAQSQENMQCRKVCLSLNTGRESLVIIVNLDVVV